MHPFRDWLVQFASQDPNLQGQHFPNTLFQLSGDFFVAFSRFEYSLKQAGFVDGDEKKVFPNWDCFARRYEEEFRRKTRNHSSIRDAIDIFCREPPRKQVLRNGRLAWVHTSEDQRVMAGEQIPTLRWLTVVVRRVRNNLFHGSKKMFGVRERDLDLLRASLVLLRCWLDLDKKVKQFFIDGLPGSENLSVEFCSSP